MHLEVINLEVINLEVVVPGFAAERALLSSRALASGSPSAGSTP